MEILAFIVPIALIVVGLAFYSYRRDRKRREALARWASQRQLAYHPERFEGFGSRYPGFACLQHGRNRYAENLIAGKLEGWQVWLFDYHYETRSRRSKGRSRTRHHRFSAAIVDSPFPLKPLRIRPEGFLDRISAAFGWDDIDFESAEFSQRYHVSSPDKRWAFDVIHGPVMETLLRASGVTFECDSRSMICYDGYSSFNASQFESAARLALTILNQIPEHARKRVVSDA